MKTPRLIEGVPARPNPSTNEGANQATNPNTTPEKTPSRARPDARVASPAGGRGGLFTPWRANLTETEPPFEIRRLDPDTWVIRQSLATSPAAPFLYLLFGTNRALLFDSGTGHARLRPAIDAIMAQRGTPGEAYPASARRHPDEHALALPAATLFELHAAAAAMTGEPVRETHADFIIVPGWPG